MTTKNKMGAMAVAASVLLLTATGVLADPSPQRGWMMDDAQREQMMREYGPGMMGPGMMGPGYGYGYGYGDGSGYGYGYGGHGRHMMGPGMMGPGMMGPGMMGPGMMGPGMMMGMGPMMAVFDDLNLTKDQRSKIWQLRRELRDQHMKLMDRMWEESEKMQDLWEKEKPDAKEIGKAYDRVFAMQREMIEQSVTFKNKLSDILNDEQRKKLKEMGPRWMD